MPGDAARSGARPIPADCPGLCLARRRPNPFGHVGASLEREFEETGERLAGVFAKAVGTNPSAERP